MAGYKLPERNTNGTLVMQAKPADWPAQYELYLGTVRHIIDQPVDVIPGSVREMGNRFFAQVRDAGTTYKEQTKMLPLPTYEGYRELVNEYNASRGSSPAPQPAPTDPPTTPPAPAPAPPTTPTPPTTPPAPPADMAAQIKAAVVAGLTDVHNTLGEHDGRITTAQTRADQAMERANEAHELASQRVADAAGPNYRLGGIAGAVALVLVTLVMWLTVTPQFLYALAIGAVVAIPVTFVASAALAGKKVKKDKKAEQADSTNA